MSEASTYGLEQFSDELENLVSQEKEQPVFLAEAQGLLKKLLPDREFVCNVMEQMITDDAFLKERIGTIDRHDLTLYLSPKGSFSMRLFVWLPSVPYPVHDHGSWGVVGGYANSTLEVKYRRLDDGSTEGHARIEERARNILHPGDTTCILPFEIHHMGSSNDQTSLTVHVYGKPLRKGFIQCFNPQNNSVHNLITPKLDKRLFAVRALGAIGGNLVKAPIEKAGHDPHPLVRWESIAAMEKVDRDSWSALLRAALSDPSEEIQNKARAAINRKGT